ncbi:hypothetical protein [Chitinophaga sp.]|uniref:hypothetical protein n=1 Tax=Chitinophaga sp. TaxID=1869181 RepID=UPI0031D40D4F
MKDQDLKELDGCKKWAEKMGSGYISYYEDNFLAPPGLTDYKPGLQKNRLRQVGIKQGVQ